MEHIYNLIKENKLEEAKELLSKIEVTESNQLLVTMLLNYIKDQEYLLSLTEEQRTEINNMITKGSECYKNRNNKEALEIYIMGEYIYDYSVFLYYLGKMYYKIHDYNESEKYLKRYIEVGSDKLPKAYLYLFKIAEYYDKCNKEEISTTLSELNKEFCPEFVLKRETKRPKKNRR